MATTYHGGTQIEHAQATLDLHTVSSGDGLCTQCKVLGPCAPREAAAKLFTRSARLPRRRPGATRPESMVAKRDGFNWLAARVLIDASGTDPAGPAPPAIDAPVVADGAGMYSLTERRAR
jgi:hypothetical protein